MTEPRGASIPRWLLRRWPLKLLSIALAFVTWLAVTTDNRLIQDHIVPLDVLLDEDAILTGEQVNRVTLRLNGSVGQFRRFEAARLRVELDLRGAAYGERTFPVESDDVKGVPPGVEWELIEPRTLSFSIARRGEKELPVEPSLDGEPAKGIELYDVAVLPQRVRVEGPEQTVARMERVLTDTISLTGRTESFQVQVSANPAEDEVRVIDPRLHTVRIELDEARKRRTFDRVPVRHGAAADGRSVRVSPETMTLTLSGPPRILDALEPEQLRLEVSVVALDPSSDGQPVVPQLTLLGVDSVGQDRIEIVTPDDPVVTVWVEETQE